MPISLTPPIDAGTAGVASFVLRTLGVQAAGIERIGGGRNSQVYRVECDNTRQYVVKRYVDPRVDARDRLGVEFSSLRWLWDHGVREVPQPIASDPDQGWAVYAYVEGQQVTREDITEADIDDTVRFLASLKALRCRQDSRSVPAASEACFSVQAILENIDLRLGRLAGQGRGEAVYEALEIFLTGEFLPFRDRIVRWCEARVSRQGASLDEVLPQEHRTFSPSDFGFHNALRLADGRLVYLDFEYFGWDDPAKILADFVMHPAMELPLALGRRFAAGLFRLFEEDRHLAQRAQTVYPLFGLKWCLILLNEFVPDDLRRRGFAGTASSRAPDLQLAQLAKAKQLLRRVTHEYEPFPYGA